MNPLPTLPHKIKYRGQWQHTSDHLRPQGCYEWMAEQLDELAPSKVLDIGCGTGNGLLALIDRFHPTTLISLEENIDCIDATVAALVGAGQRPLAHPRLSYELDSAKKTYGLICSHAPVELESGISIVQTDAGCGDPAQDDVLVREGPFDAIAVWLIRTDGHYLHNIGSTAATDYRWQIQRRICEMAQSLLRPGGWLQLVDRSAFPLTEGQQQDVVQRHESLLEPTRLKFLRFSNRSYEEAGERGIPMATAPGKTGQGLTMGLNSLISQLPH